MSNGQGTHFLGSFLTGTLGASFVAGVEMDVDPMWSLIKKIVVVALGGVLAGIMHNIGSKLAGMSLSKGSVLFSRGAALVLRLCKKPQEPTPTPPKIEKN